MTGVWPAPRAAARGSPSLSNGSGPDVGGPVSPGPGSCDDRRDRDPGGPFVGHLGLDAVGDGLASRDAGGLGGLGLDPRGVGFEGEALQGRRDRCRSLAFAHRR